MIDNPRSPRVRAVAKLAKKSARIDSGRFLLEGPQAVGEALEYRPDRVVEVFATNAAREKHVGLADRCREHGIELIEVTTPVLAQLADTVSPQGVVAVARQDLSSLDALTHLRPRLVAILHEVRDPGNAGTILRAADAAGADAVVFSGDTVDPYHPKVVRSTTGSLFHVPVVAGVRLADTVVALRSAGLAVVAADIKGDDLLEARARGELSAPTAWLFGNEARGLSDDDLALADRALRLPIYGQAESLNLATAASVCLYESAFAQRGALLS